MTDHKHRAVIERTALKIEKALEEFADQIEASARRDLTDMLIKVLAAPDQAARAQALAASGLGQEDVAPKQKRAPYGATRDAIEKTFTTGIVGPDVGATLDDFARVASMLGYEVAMSSLRSMAWDMEKRGELRREKGRWFARVGIEGVAPSPSEESATASTPGRAENSGSLVAG